MFKVQEKLLGGVKTLVSIPGWAQDMHESGNATKQVVAAYLASPWVQRAISIKGDAIASVPVVIELPSGEQITKHAALDVMRSVNEEWNYGDLWRYTEAGLNVWGSGYWEKRRVGKRLTELFYLNPSTVKVKTSPDGIGGFEQHIGGALRAKWERNDIVYFRGMYDPRSELTGLSPLEVAVSSALADQHADKYLAAFFKNSAIPAVIFSTDSPMPEPDVNRFLAWLKKLFGGAENAHKVGVLGNGLKPFNLSSTVRDLALSEVRAAIHQNISTAIGVPELLISPAGMADLTPVKVARQTLWELTILPRLSWYEEVLNSELLYEFSDLVEKGARFAFDTSAVSALQEDLDLKVDRLLKLLEANVLRPDVVAKALGYEDKDMPARVESAPPSAPAVQPVAQDEPEDDAEDDEMTSQKALAAQDYERWCGKAIKALAAGRSAAVKFASDYIPGSEHARISRGLLGARTAEDAREVFAGARAESDADRIIRAVAEAARKS